MKILVLDDDAVKVRAPQADKHDFRDDEFTQVCTWEDFFSWLYDSYIHWDEVWLDHDLGLRGETGSDYTYEIVSRAIVHETYPHVGKFRIISNNAAAAHRMWDDLHSLGIEVEKSPMWMLGDFGIYRDGIFVKGW
jgi:hypothetical protein